jgi:hypothetical protein
VWVQVLERKKDLGHIVRHIALHGRVVAPDLAQKGASLDVFQLEVQVFFVLERAVDVHQERALRG